MNVFTKSQLSDLQKVRQFPCISYYLPVQKVGADTRQGAIRLRQWVKSTAEALRSKGMRTPVIEEILKPVQALYDDALFWENQEATLVLFLNADGLIIHQLPISTEESVTIADHFMIRPLLPIFGQDGYYHMLTLGLAAARLYLCTRHSQTEIKMTKHPESLKEVFNTYSVEKQLQHHSGSGKGRNASGGSGGSVFHGSESMKDSAKDRIEEYFRQIDNSLKASLPNGQMPLVLVCVDYLFPLFKAVSRESRLMDEHISGSPDTLKKEVLLRNGWEIVRPVFEKDKLAALAVCQNLMGTERVIEDIRLVLPAALNKQVDSLFLMNGRQIWSSFDPESGRVALSQDYQPAFGEEELLNLAAMQVLQNGGQVFVLSPEEMPDSADCLAVLRF